MTSWDAIEADQMRTATAQKSSTLMEYVHTAATWEEIAPSASYALLGFWSGIRMTTDGN